MAPGRTAVSFDEIIQAGEFESKGQLGQYDDTSLLDRQRRKNEALAKEIFGKAKYRRASAPGNGSRKASTGPSLASRVGVNKVRTLLTLSFQNMTLSD